jgi:ribosomal-protein-alanine N-acetyltransferase
MLDLTTAFASFPALETERYQLRAVTLDDAAAIYAIMRDPQVLRYFGQLPMTAIDQAIEKVQRIQAAFEARQGVRWAITSRASGELLGTAGFWRLINDHARAEIGYELARAAWGQGVMTEALGAMLGFGFAVLGLHSVEANIHPDNTGSRRVLEKLGFVQEGYLRQNYYDVVEDGFTDTALFSLLKATWMQRTA